MVAAFGRKLFAVLLTMSTYTGLTFLTKDLTPVFISVTKECWLVVLQNSILCCVTEMSKQCYITQYDNT